MLSIAPRTCSLDPDEPLAATLTPGRSWWEPLRPWPDDVHFEDVSAAVLDLERLLDSGRLGPPPAPCGCYRSSSLMAVESRFAEPDLGRAA
jgi:hypothetical protein